jgi:hypothetical protein
MVCWFNFIVSQLQYLKQSNGLDHQITFLITCFPINYLKISLSVVYLNLFLNNVVVSFAIFLSFISPLNSSTFLRFILV